MSQIDRMAQIQIKKHIEKKLKNYKKQEQKYFENLSQISTKPEVEEITQTATETEYKASDFEFIDIPIVQLTQNYFEDPFKLIEDLYKKNYHQVGIVKLIPPENTIPNNFWQQLSDKLGQKKLVSRIQTINEMKSGKSFKSNIEGHTLEEFFNLATNFSKNYKYQTQSNTTDPIRRQEIEFWSIVDHGNRYQNVKVEYAADLVVSKYTTGFQNEQKNLNLNTINQQKNSLLQVMSTQAQISGISIPWLYLGMQFANFCWHTEDLYMSSLNYMHGGSPKIWYAIPPKYAKDFEQVFEETYHQKLQNNPRLLYDIVCQVSPVQLKQKGIKVLRTAQKPGEYILTLDKTYHSGFSTVLNCSEAVNLAHVTWLELYQNAVNQYRDGVLLKKVSFPIDMLVSNLINQIPEVKFTEPVLAKLINHQNHAVNRLSNSLRQIKELYDEYSVFHFAQPDDKYDRYVCQICSDYMYFGYIYCTKCLVKTCFQHISPCVCLNTKIKLFIRHPIKRLESQIFDAQIYCQQLRKQQIDDTLEIE